MKIYITTDKTIYAEADEVVYSFKGHDYGCASMDTYITGIQHISVTRGHNEPFFTIPVDALRELNIVPHQGAA